MKAGLRRVEILGWGQVRKSPVVRVKMRTILDDDDLDVLGLDPEGFAERAIKMTITSPGDFNIRMVPVQGAAWEIQANEIHVDKPVVESELVEVGDDDRQGYATALRFQMDLPLRKDVGAALAGLFVAQCEEDGGNVVDLELVEL